VGVSLGSGNQADVVGRLFGMAMVAMLVCAACALGCASAARADLINLGTCNSASLSQAFAPWGDPSEYELAPGGDFESSSWTLAGGAQRVGGSEPFAATGTLGSYSLSLPAGASAQSPVTCLDAAYPTLRMFIAGSGVLAVDIVDNGMVIPAGLAVAAGNWQPSTVMLTSAPLLGLLSGGTANASLLLTGVLGSPVVDDVFIDPWNRGP